MFLLGVSTWFYKLYQDNKEIPNLKRIELTYYQELFNYKEHEYQKHIELLLKEKEQLKSDIHQLNSQTEKIQKELLTILRS